MRELVENWVEVVGFDDYQISDLGRLKNKHGKILKGSIHKQGYFTTNITRDKVAHFKYFHILVAEAFLGYEANKGVICVDHINTDRLDNTLENLQVITHRKNLSKDRENKTGYQGVCETKFNTFKAVIIYGGKSNYLGSFNTAEEASTRYQEELKKVRAGLV